MKMDEDFKYFSEKFNGKLLKLVKEEGGYEYTKSFKKVSEDKLTDKCEIFNSLKDERISEKDYKKANNVCNAFKMNAMGNYHDLCLNTDVLLLADVFENLLINTCLDYYELDPCRNFSNLG